MSSSFHLEPPPQNELERLLLKAGEEPALRGRMYRLLWESELFVFVPDHPEMHDVLMPLRNGDEFVFCMCPHPEGTFMAVFTSEAAADWAAAQIPGVKPAMANLPGEVLFRLAETAKVWVRVNHGMNAFMAFGPGNVA
ncbi:MAG TPA: SseB family protein [Chthoniobacteraceae bacterium]|jgi:hypothetical protein|nr:SseB family protein [Chthoniobacteraceae bacterium]